LAVENGPGGMAHHGMVSLGHSRAPLVHDRALHVRLDRARLDRALRGWLGRGVDCKIPQIQMGKAGCGMDLTGWPDFAVLGSGGQERPGGT
jgi:hypothetical protein